jgi:hypothetical protein
MTSRWKGRLNAKIVPRANHNDPFSTLGHPIPSRIQYSDARSITCLINGGANQLRNVSPPHVKHSGNILKEKDTRPQFLKERHGPAIQMVTRIKNERAALLGDGVQLPSTNS